MQSSLAISARSANAMTDVADATRNNAQLMQVVMQKQMRAYLVADIGAGTYQDKNLRFAASSVLLKTGFTPARNVSYKIEAGVFDPADVNETLLSDIGHIQKHDAVLSPKQTFVIQGVVKDRFPDNEVEVIMKGDKKRLFVWGTVTYDDIFDNSWTTNFVTTTRFI